MTDDEAKNVMMRLFIKFNGDLPPIDTQLDEIEKLFNEVITQYRAEEKDAADALVR